MKWLGCAVVIALALGNSACTSNSNSGPATLAGTYSGTLTETYTCGSGDVPPSFQLPETFVITQNSADDATITIASCNNSDFDGTVNGDSIDVTPSGTGFSCQQTDGEDDISIDDFNSGSLILDGNGNLAVTLGEDVTISGDSSCTGVATGTLVYQPGT